MAAPSQLQTGLLRGLSGLAKGFSEGYGQESTRQEDFNQKRMLQEALDKRKREDDDAKWNRDSVPNSLLSKLALEQTGQTLPEEGRSPTPLATALIGAGSRERIAGGDGNVTLGQLWPNAPEHLKNYPVPAKQRIPTIMQIPNITKPNEGEATKASQDREIMDLTKDLGRQWKVGGLGKGTVKEAGKGLISRFLPGQISQRTAGPEYTNYQNTRAMTSEVALRAATGAATNPSEVSFYQGRLPEPGDKPEVAIQKINDWMGRLLSRNEQKAVQLESRGLAPDAAALRARGQKLLNQVKTQLLQDFGGIPAATYDADDLAAAQDVLKNETSHDPATIQEAQQIIQQFSGQ